MPETARNAPADENAVPVVARMRALVVEDDPESRTALVAVLEHEGFEVASSSSFAQARSRLAAFQPELLLVDLQLPDGNGLDLLASALDGSQTSPPDVVVVTGHSSVETAVEALRRGAVDYLAKPIDIARLHAVLAQTAVRQRFRHEIRTLRSRLRELGRFGSMVGTSPVMRTLFDQIARVAPTDAAVLLLGDSGTGKELVAETVHELSRRSGKPMISINCGAISTHLIESELFGHERGSFTGADRIHRGHFERAHGGTLFLDEISEMPYELQVKLLRVLESGSFTRVGGDRPIQVDVRILAASKPDLDAAAAAGRFRADLLYRLKVFPIVLPPLRERVGDLALLVEHFLAELNRTERTDKRLLPAASALLVAHDWPGNVRELKHALERAFILSDTEIGPEAFSDLRPSPAPARGATSVGQRTVVIETGRSLADAERLFVLATLDSVRGNKARTAELLEISTRTLYSRLREYRTSEPAPDSGARTRLVAVR